MARVCGVFIPWYIVDLGSRVPQCTGVMCMYHNRSYMGNTQLVKVITASNIMSSRSGKGGYIILIF